MIIFLHGFLGCPKDWEGVQENLSVPSRALTLPGHGKMPLDLPAFEQKIPEGSTVVGYSMGGRLAMHLAKKKPKKIKELILLSANPGLESGREERRQSDQKWIDLLRLGMEPFLKQWYNQELFSSFALSATLKRRRMLHDPEQLAEVIKQFSPARMENLWPHLKSFPCPLLFLFGENDIKYHSIKVRLESDFECMTISKASHPVHLEAPKEVAKQIMRRIL